MSLETVLADLKAAEKLTTNEQKIQFCFKHPVLTLAGLAMWGLTALARVGLWVALIAGFILGLKCCWLAIQWLWKLI